MQKIVTTGCSDEVKAFIKEQQLPFDIDPDTGNTTIYVRTESNKQHADGVQSLQNVVQHTTDMQGRYTHAKT